MPQLRPTVPNDTPRITALIAAIFREYDCVLNTETEDVHLQDPGEYFRGHGGEFWVVEDGGEIVATGGFVLNGEVAELKSLYVDPLVRRQGWGRRLTELVIANARELGCTRLELWSDTRFTKAHALYRSLGFTQEGERDLHDSNHSREYGFCLLLKP
jgi:putative acetyltransferase